MKKYLLSIFFFFFLIQWVYSLDYNPSNVIIGKVSQKSTDWITITKHNRFKRLSIDDISWNNSINLSGKNNEHTHQIFQDLKIWDLIVFYSDSWINSLSVKIDCQQWVYNSLKDSIFLQTGWWLDNSKIFLELLTCEQIDNSLLNDAIYHWLDQTESLLQELKWLKNQNTLIINFSIFYFLFSFLIIIKLMRDKKNIK